MAQPDSETPPGIPRWVKALIIIVLVLMVLVGGFMLFSGGEHGPGGHALGMVTGFTLLARRHAPEHSGLGGGTVASDDISSEDDH